MRKTNAFTLVELLVVIAIIGMLVAILLPAVNGAREAGRRTTCKNNLRQQAVALRSYAAQFDEEMPSIWNKGGTNVWQTYSWRVALLPYMEEQPRYDRINQQQMPLSPQNAAVAGPVDAFSCPSAPGSPRVANAFMGTNQQLGTTDYVAVFDIHSPQSSVPLAGAWFGGRSPASIPLRVEGDNMPAGPESGDMAAIGPDLETARLRKLPSSLLRVRDGQSTTVLMVEQAGKPNFEGGAHAGTDELLMDGGGNPLLDENGQPIRLQSQEGPWITAEYASFSEARVNYDNQKGPFAFHNGVTVAMCDGSVHFWPSGIEPQVMFALLSREGSEIVSNDDW